MSNDKTKPLAPAADPVAVLAARLDAVERENAQLRAQFSGGAPSVLRTAAEFEADKQRAANTQKRAQLKAAAKLTKDGMRHYLVGPQGAYREGVLYSGGEAIAIPADQEPSVTWLPVKDNSPQESPRAAPVAEGRASDRDVA